MVDLRLRILVLANLPPHVMGGAENQVSRLVACWTQQNTHVEVAGHRIPKGQQQIGASLVRTHHLRSWKTAGRAGRALGYFFSLLKLVLQRKKDFDVVYCRGLGDGAIAMALLRWLGFCRWPLVAVPINARGAGDASFIRSIPGWRFFCRRLNQEISAINLINLEIAHELNALGITKPPRSTIPNGIPLLPKLERSSVAATRRLVWTGRLEPQKGIDLLLTALAACQAAGKHFHLTLWGDGALLPQLHSQAVALGLIERVSFAGVCTAEQVRSALQDADIFVLPSLYEGMSNSALEAMEASLPVLCTRCGGIDQSVAEGAGWVCEPNDLATLEIALLDIFDASDEEVLARGRYARALVESRFNIQQVATDNLRLLRSVSNPSV
ncbi:hypothetical protein CLI92_07720 [Vandammella animalimorsus]|uniref:Glycosyltransferase subfamily 4-like N-terminal domain-containing protein n=1 Tax=Vandammella animalimorsus TaxID=2029117 RepID=A0A2A2T5Z6_9BURK|nr:glycosyltransferase family 4 protein [Vandammella animalimorsus]PAT32256.1 hypothetical protein CK626_06145 [Vandammella animalimorsus]PAX16619.1 hypothetical protein CLI92_07720 [Vandammella animalimorsus]PAX19249.1 hypothetical protein CLI93_08740 [Vandammella animalimorsus]